MNQSTSMSGCRLFTESPEAQGSTKVPEDPEQGRGGGMGH